MKYRSIASAALLGAASAAHDSLTFAVMRFNGKEIFDGRVDPITNPGEASPHVHTVFGGSNFGLDATGESLAQSSCTNAKVKGDKSAYWQPRVYFHDEDAGTFDPVPVLYTNVYYFFDATDDDIVAFPQGLAVLSGDVNLRTPPTSSGTQNLDPEQGDINNVFFTCTRTSQDPPSWPADSDGSAYGLPSTPDDHQGVGFPLQKCVGAMASPLRADIHFPSCYNPDAGLTNHNENMEFPSAAGNGKLNCPEGYIHVPRLLFEIYWDTAEFDDRWTPDGKTQPYVLSNGDVTGYSLHADFLAAWDEDLLQKIIDTCDVQHADMDTCPGIESESNKDECQCQGDVGSFATDDSSVTELPGNNPLSGFQYGDAPATGDSGSDDDSYDDAPATDAPSTDAPSTDAPSTEEPVEEESPETPGTEAPTDGSYGEAPAAPETEEPADEGYDEAPATQAPLPTAEPVCATKTKTVVETVTVWEDAVETAAAKAKRHAQRHAHHHRI